jgi:hypothetical protein
MQTNPLDDAETLLRRAVTYRQFREIDPRLTAYCREADRELKSLTAHDPRHKALLTHVLEVLEWTRLMLQAARAICAAKLDRAVLIDRYLGTQVAGAVPSTRVDL